MAFQTGVATSFINLLDALRLFAMANGWTENGWAAVGSDQRLHLQKGSIFANFLAEADLTDLWIQGSLGYNGASAWNAQPSAMPQGPRLSASLEGAITWPVTYWFFLHTAPDSIEVVIRYQPTKFQWLTFGTLTAYGSWTGGAYFGASAAVAVSAPNAFSGQEENTPPPVLFHDRGGGFGTTATCYLYAAIDSQTWWNNHSSAAGRVTSTRHLWPLVNRSLSAFNGLDTLQPIDLFALRPDAHYSPVGRIEHARHLNVLNHNAADIIDIGGQKWMLFPWLEKSGSTDAANPTTLHAGWAIKYDGP